MDKALIEQHFTAHAETARSACQNMVTDVACAADICIQTLNNNQKILIAGNGGSACDAQHFAGELINRYVAERKPLPCIALGTDGGVLTAIANDYSYDQVFSKQIEALGQSGDCLIAITTSGQSGNICAAIDAAKAKHMQVILLTGGEGGKARTMLDSEDCCITSPSRITAHIQEMHIAIGQLICELVEKELFYK